MPSPATRLTTALERRFGGGQTPDRGQTPVLPGSDSLGSVPDLSALAVLNERSVCRSYAADPVPEPLLQLLLATALAAPTKSDLQQATIVRLADPAKRAAICALLPRSPWLAGAPELLVFCADGFRLRRLFARAGREFPNEHLDAFFNASVDAAIALATFVSAAELAGLGTCPISQVRDHIDTIDRLLALPDWVVPVAGLAVGYPAKKEPLSARLALSATVHTDAYDTAAVERELDAYPARRGRDWNGDKVRQYSERMRADFGAFVRRKRFKVD